MTNPEPRFINPSGRVVYVTDENGNQRHVRPIRELDRIVGRTEADCICVGEHYAKFPGLLERFRGGAVAPPHPEPIRNPMDPNDPSIAARAQQAGEGGTAVAPPPAGEVAGPEGDEDPEVAGGVSVIDEVADTEDEVDYPSDAELTDIEGIGERLANNLTEAGIGSAAELAAMQDTEQVEKIRQVAGVRNTKHAMQLVERAQTLLGWEDEDESDTE